MTPKTRQLVRIGLSVAVLSVAWWSQRASTDTQVADTGAEARNVAAPAPPPRALAIAAPAVHKAHAARRSDVIVTGVGRVAKTLPDDNKGSRHQRFILDVGQGLTVLVAHNIDLARPLPLSRGDLVRFKGEYEFNAKGGVVHWTHHDPRERHPGGFLESGGKRVE